MPDNLQNDDLFAQLEKTTRDLEALSPNDSALQWGRNFEAQAEIYWQLYQLYQHQRFLENAIVAYEAAANYYRDGAEIHFAAIQRRLQKAYVDMARFQQATTYFYKARDAGSDAQAFYQRHNSETREIHFEILEIQAQILTALAVLEKYKPYGDDSIYIGKYIINETRDDADMLETHIEGHRVLGKAYLGLARVLEYEEAREYLLEATRTLGKLRRFSQQDEGKDSIIRGLLLMGHIYIELEELEHNPDYLPPALRAMQQAMDVNTSLGNEIYAAVTYYTISLLYERMEKLTQTADAAKQSAEHYQSIGMNGMALVATFRGWYFAQNIVVRGVTIAPMMLLNVWAMFHRRAILPFVLA